MPEDLRYERSQATDRESAAAYLRTLADRLAAGEELLPADEDDTSLAAPAQVELGLRATDGDAIRVQIGLEWESGTPESGQRAAHGSPGEPTADSRAGNAGPEAGDADPQEGGAHPGAGSAGPGAETASQTDEEAHQSTGWASAGASDGYTLPLLESLEDADDEFERAAYFLRKGKHEAALSRFEDAIEQTPRQPRRRYHVATVCWQLGRPGDAAKHFEVAHELAPEDVVIALDYASFLWSQGQVGEAETVYESALEFAPDDPAVHSALGRFRWETENDVEAAVEHLSRALELDADHGLGHLNYAVLLRHGGKEKRAEEHFQRALDLRGEDPIVQTEYGHFLWERGDIEEAAKHYARAE